MSQLGVDTGEEIRRTGIWARVLRGIELVELAVGAILLLAILALVMMLVLARVTPVPSEVWTGELARYGLIWLAFGLSGYLMGREEHITLDVIDHVLPRLGQRIVYIFSLMVVAATCLAFAYEGYDLYSSTSVLKSPAAGIPIGWIYILPTAGMLLTAFRCLLLIVAPGARPQFVDDDDDAVPPPTTTGPKPFPSEGSVA